MGVITWLNKIPINAPVGSRVNQWRDLDANETKDAVNDNDTRVGALESSINVIWVEIGDVFVYKGTNTGSAVEVGDIIKYYPTTSRFIHARVNALPYTDDANLTFFEDIQTI